MGHRDMEPHAWWDSRPDRRRTRVRRLLRALGVALYVVGAAVALALLAVTLSRAADPEVSCAELSEGVIVPAGEVRLGSDDAEKKFG